MEPKLEKKYGLFTAICMVVGHRDRVRRFFQGADHSAENQRQYASGHFSLAHRRLNYAGVHSGLCLDGAEISEN